MIIIIFVLLLIYFLTRDKNTCKKESFVSNIITNKAGLQFDTNYHGNSSDINAGTNQPGPSFWNPKNAFIGTDGELHLRYQQNADKVWESAEAVCLTPLTYGDYYFTVQFVDPQATATGGGAGSYDSPADWNTTFGAYTFSKANLTDGGPCGNYCYKLEEPNACHEIDIVEFGKSRDPNNFGMAQWGTQPWFTVDNNNPNNNCKFNSSNLNRDMWDLNKNNKWKAIGDAGNNITFRMNWQNGDKKNLQFWAAAGDYGPEPWNKGFNDQNFDNATSTNAWSFFYYIDGNPYGNNGISANIPEDKNTYLHFNLWAPGVLPKIGPIDNKPKEVIVKNICLPVVNDIYIGSINCYKNWDFIDVSDIWNQKLYGIGVLADRDTQYINSNSGDDNHSFMFTNIIKKFRQIKIVVVEGLKTLDQYGNWKGEYFINRFDLFDKSQTNFAGQGNIAHGDINSNWTITIDINDDLFKYQGFYLLSYWNDCYGQKLKYNVYLSP